jgi:beta-xylosidase
MDQHFKDLWSTKRDEEPSLRATTDENIDPITAEELTGAIKYNNKKAS